MHDQRNAPTRPACRMLCLDCRHLAEPDTLLQGSDRLELAAWASGVLPGLAYCVWRHLGRVKVCEACGGGNLMRASRALAARTPAQAPPARGTRIRSERGHDFPWPGGLRSPRERMRLGGPAAIAMALAFGLVAGAGLGALSGASLEWAAALACFAGVWCAWQLQPIAWERDPFDACAAWAPDGRPIRIERA